MSSSMLDLDPASEFKFNALQNEGKQLAAEGKLMESLKKFELAKKMCPTEKVLRRILKLKEHLKTYCAEEPNSESISEVPGDVFLRKEQENLVNKSYLSRDPSLTPKVLSNIQNLEQSRYSKTDELSPHSQSKFRELRKAAKELSYEGRYDEALQCFRKALRIFDCPKIKRFMEEIELVMKNSVKVVEQNENLADVVKPEASVANVSGFLNITKQNTVIPSGLDHPDVTVKSEFQFPSSSNHHKVSTVSETSDYEEKLAKVKELYFEARELAAEGKLKEALKLLKKAFAVHETERVLKQIKNIEKLLSEEPEEDEMTNITSDFQIFHEIYNKLYSYQREGVAWMWQLFKKKKGGVLGDDMGLGKTFQVIAFISGMIDADLVKHVLIIMPVSLICNWGKEFKKWCPGISVSEFHGGSKKERERNLLKVQKRGHVLLTSYGMLVSNLNSLTNMDNKEFIWDYVILDEGHKIKNPTKTTKAVHDIPAKNRLVLTGTPIQNNLKELWSLYDFVHQGTLLGSLKTFKIQYENPITRSREKDATAGEKRLGTEMAGNLKSLIKPYFLRRTKEEIWGNNSEKNEVDELENQIEKMSISKLNAKKNDLILWTFMSEPQIDIYTNFLHSDTVKAILVSKRSPLVELTTLKKICDHPRLLSKRACTQLGLNGKLDEDLLKELDDESSQASTIDNVSDENLLKESGKLKLVIQLLENLRETGHRTLVFSLSRKILDMIHRILVNRNWKVMRVDGTISKMEERERRIQKFQRDPSYPVFLLTTQVGGVGITLTAADRVIIYDPSWNPATDAQAVDRVYRIGQQKNVIVYRIITCGTVEEKIYRRQVFKDSITRQTTGSTESADPYRYFSKQELRELFSLEDPHTSATQLQLSEMHSSERNTSEELETHIAFLDQLNIFGISDHDLMFSRNIQDHTEDNDQFAVSDDYIKRQVAAAHQLIQKEAFVVEEGMRLAGLHSRPYQETLPLPKKAVTKDGYRPPVLPEIVDLTEDAMIFSSFKKKHMATAFQPSGFIDLTSEQSLDKDFDENAGAVSSTEQNEQLQCERGRFFSISSTQNSPVIPSYEDISEVHSISHNDLSTEEFIRRLSCENKLPIKSEEFSPTQQCNISRDIITEELVRKLSCEITLPINSEELSPTEQYNASKDISTEELVRRLSREIKLPIKSDELSPTQYNTSRDISTEELVRKLSCEIKFPIKSDELSAPEQCNTSRVSIKDNEHILYENKKGFLSPMSVSDSEDPQQESGESLRKSEIDLIPKKQDASHNSSKFVSDVQEKFQHNLTRLMTAEDLDDLSFDNEVSNTTFKTARKSCARQSTVYIPDSDNSQQDSCPPSLDTTANLVDESEDHDSDSSNSSSLSFVPDSAQNTPIIDRGTKPVLQAETPLKSVNESLSESTPVKYDSDSVWRKRDGSARRITPLKVNRSFTCQDSSFSQALAASPILSLPHSPVKITNNSKQSFSDTKINTSLDHSPTKKWRKSNEANVLDSDLEDENVPPVKITDNSRHSFSIAKFNTSFDSPIRKWRKKTKINALDSDSDDENVQQMESVVAAKPKDIDTKPEMSSKFSDAISSVEDSIDKMEKHLESESEDENVSKMDSVLDTAAEEIDMSVELSSKHSGTSQKEDDFFTDHSSDNECSSSEEFGDSDESGSVFSQE